VQRKFNFSISNAFALDEIKKICKKYDFECTINDFVMAIFCEAVSEYLFETVCGSKQSEYEKRFGDRLYFRFFTVFNMRSLMETNLVRLANEFGKGQFESSDNEISTVPIRLPCGNMTFDARLRQIHFLFYKLKNGPLPIITLLFLKCTHFLFGLRFINWILASYVSSKCTFTLSNLMGPKQPLPSGNDECAKNIFNGTNPTHTPIACGIMSYVNSITFTLVADDKSINNTEQFIACLNRVYDKQVTQKLN